MKQRFEIPYKPDSMNTHWRRGNNVTYLSKKGREFRDNVQQFIKLQKNGSNAFGQSLNLKDLNLIKIPLLLLSIQKQIVIDFEVLESEISQREQKLANLQGKYNEILNRHL